LKEEHGHIPETTDKYFSSKSKYNNREKYNEGLRKIGKRDHGADDVGKETQTFEVQERNEFLGAQNITKVKRHSTSRNRNTDTAILAYKDSPTQKNDMFECLQVDKPKHKLKNSNKSNSEKHRIKTHVSNKSSADFSILPNITNARRDKCSDSSRINDVKVQNSTDLLVDTYDMPLDVPKSVPRKSNFNDFGTSHGGCGQQFGHEENDKEIIQQQQLWLLNGSPLSPDKFDEEVPVERKISENYDVNSDVSIDSFEHEHQNNIYMEVEPSTQLKADPSIKP
jgi:hypothetical protein